MVRNSCNFYLGRLDTIIKLRKLGRIKIRKLFWNNIHILQFKQIFSYISYL